MPRLPKLDLPPIETGRVYLAIVPYGWGKHTDPAEALRRARSEGRRSKPAAIFNCPADAVVDGMGYIAYEYQPTTAPPFEVWRSK